MYSKGICIRERDLGACVRGSPVMVGKGRRNDSKDSKVSVSEKGDLGACQGKLRHGGGWRDGLKGLKRSLYQRKEASVPVSGKESLKTSVAKDHKS